MTGNPPLIVILGPTAVGKTGLSIELAQRLGGEIIGADSRQVYRFMNIGTAKPTLQQQAQIPHHLIDIVNPDEELSLALYQEKAYQAIEDTFSRGCLPLLVGGTGQYLTAVIEGWSIPEVPPNSELRTELEAYATAHGAAALYARLTTLDPKAAQKIHHNNLRRVIRALEVCLETGQPISELQRKHAPPYQILQIGITMERERLYARADQRVDQMLKAGFVSEVSELLDRGYSPELYSMSGLGYRELALHLLKGWPLAAAVTATKSATHDFIRRQYTWFRGHDSGIRWYDGEYQHTAIVDFCLDWLKERS